ncbi:Sugar transport protein MST8 [Camellia lanceoleosa]|uniref:Sugar transport protein MST8 n=1 Tax=Camellia lanceoleosa TaxID=1840588 RepID=A0ACC0IIF1_9ERIC|nr:Sugar transport protein MST8 [Camellia lanceoleosa]
MLQSAVAILNGAKFGVTEDATNLGMQYSSILVCCICIFVTTFAFSWGPLGWLVSSEIFPLEIQSSTQSIVMAVNMSFTFLIAQIFLSALCMVKFDLFIIFAGLVLIMSLFVIFFISETNNIPIEEMSQVWRGHWYWKKFVDDEKEIKMKNGSP